jgi:hypothetical protein
MQVIGSAAAAAADEHVVTITPIFESEPPTPFVRAECTCGWRAHNGAILRQAGAERIATAHTTGR